MHWNPATGFLFGGTIALKSTVILAAAWLVAYLLRNRSAASRHLLWTATFAIMLALPLLSISLPSLIVPIAPLPGITFQTTAHASPENLPSALHSIEAPAKTGPARPSLLDWRLLLVLLWCAGAVASLLRTTLAWLATWRIRRISPQIHVTNLQGLSQTIGLRDAVTVLETRAGTMPMSFGIIHPAISLPADAAHWDAERREFVLLHELAHVRRNDFALNLLARTALSLHWWNPIAWIAWRECQKEQERAADDIVLNAGASATNYAGHLLEIARTMQTSTMAAGVAMARRSQLEGRLLAILDSKVNHKTGRRASALAAALLAIAVVIPLAMLRAQDAPAQVPADVDATIRAAIAQKNHKMLEDAAKAEEAAQKFDLARKLMDSSLQVREEVSGSQSVDYGVGLLQIAQLERRRGHIDDAVDFYTRAAAVLGNKPDAAPALVYLGFNALRNKNYSQANSYFEQAKVAAPEKSGDATMWQAVAQERQGNMQQADALYQQAINMPDTSSPGQTTILRVYAQFLERQGRSDDAKTMRDRASTLQNTQSAIDRAKAPMGPNVYRIGGGVSAPKPLSKPEPQYSEEARVAKLAGTVTLSLVIGADGLARDINIVKGLGLGLDENAIAAVSQWRFEPGKKDGQPVPVQAMIEVNFRLM